MAKDTKHYSQLLCELTNLRQEQNEIIYSFICRVQTCLRRTNDAIRQKDTDSPYLDGKLEMLQEIALIRFIYFSNPTISNILRVRDFNNLNEAISIAIREDQVQSERFNFPSLSEHFN